MLLDRPTGYYQGVDPATARSVPPENEWSELAAALVARTSSRDWSVPPRLEAGGGRELGGW